MNEKASGPARWTRGGERVLASTRILDLRAVRYDHPERAAGREYVVMTAPEWVNVVALTPDGMLVLVRQFRFGINDFSLEIPGGMVESAEDPLAAAARELREETGFVGTEPCLMGSVCPNPAIQNNRCHLVLIEGAERRLATAWDHDEEIEVITAPADEVIGWARTGKIRHSLVMCCLFLFEDWWKKRK